MVDERVVSIHDCLWDHHGEVTVKANPIEVEGVEGLHSLGRGKVGSAVEVGKNRRDDVSRHAVNLDLVPVGLQVALAVDLEVGAHRREGLFVGRLEVRSQPLECLPVPISFRFHEPVGPQFPEVAG